MQSTTDDKRKHSQLTIWDYITEGYQWVVDMDLEKFFDTVNQSKLIQVLSNTVKAGRVVSLIHKYLRAGTMVNGMFEESTEGVPQGGPLSPLLGNVMLNESDQEMGGASKAGKTD